MFKFFSNKILNGQSQSITSAALVLALASLASRLLGLLRDRLLAGHFGAGDTLDVYYAAFRMPDLIYNLLILGALSAGFIPVFVDLWRREGEGNKEAWRFVNSILNILVFAMIALGAFFFIFAPYLMKFITPGFGGEKLVLTVALTRIMFLSPILLGVSAVLGGVLQSMKRFLVFSLTPIFYNLGIILGILFLVPQFGIYGLAWGVVLGALMHMAIQLPSSLALGWRWQLVLNWRQAGVGRLAKLMAPRTLTLAVAQLNFVAITVLASGLAAGSLAIFNLAYNIWSFPLGILAGSLAIAAFPTLAQSVAVRDWSDFAKTFSAAFRQILFLIIPSSVLLVVLCAQIVRVVLGAGQFGMADIAFTVNTLQYLTLGLFAEALNLLLIRGFFALEDTKTPFWLGLISSAVRIFGAWFFSFSLGAAGLALGFAAGGIINFILLWFFLERKTGNLNSREISASGLKIMAASFLAGGSAYWALQITGKFLDTHKVLSVLTQGLAAGVVGIFVYFIACLILKSPEMRAFWSSIKNRPPFKSVVQEKEMIDEP